MNTAFLLIALEINTSAEYIIGAILTLFILGYLLYSLIKPEEF